MPAEDLLTLAKSSTTDFYALLGVHFENSASDIRRAYRKTALKYHPDKLGKDFDPEKFHLLQVANDVLSDPAAKALYDQGRQAKEQKERKDAAFEGKRREMKEDLERREREGGTAFVGTAMKRERTDDGDVDLAAMREAGKRRRLAADAAKRAAGIDIPPSSEAAPSFRTPAPEPVKPDVNITRTTTSEDEEDEVARLERIIAMKTAEKAQRKAEKRARKSGIYMHGDLRAAGEPKAQDPISTPLKHKPTTDSRGPKADLHTLATPKFASSPLVGTSTPSGGAEDQWASTRERLREAERKRLEDEVRKQEASEL